MFKALASLSVPLLIVATTAPTVASRSEERVIAPERMAVLFGGQISPLKCCVTNDACKSAAVTCPGKDPCTGNGPAFQKKYAKQCGEPGCPTCNCGQYVADPRGRTFDCLWMAQCVQNLDGSCSTSGPVVPGSQVQGVWSCAQNEECPD